MNESEHDLPSSNFSASKTGLSEGYDQLRNFFVATLLALLILGFSVDYFIYQQMNFMRKDLETVRPQLSLMLDNYQKVEDPQIKSFVNALANFGRSHSDFVPVLAKYKIAPSAAPVAPAAAPTVAPPVSSKKK